MPAFHEIQNNVGLVSIKYFFWNSCFQAFRHSYSFLSHIRAEEKQQLKEELKTQTDSKRIDKIKYLLQRMVMYLFKLIGKNNKKCRHRVLEN
jgi:hypothetical protein